MNADQIATATLLTGFGLSLFFVIRELIRQNSWKEKVEQRRMYLDRAERNLRQEIVALMCQDDAAFRKARKEFHQNMQQADKLMNNER